MTEGQWLWMLVHQTLDNEEQVEKMCNKCKDSLDQERCSSCGERTDLDTEVNPNFDEEFFKKLKKSI